MRVGEHLHLDVARPGQVPLEQHPVVAEGGRASRRAPASASWNAAGSVTARMPLPPPPATALISTG